MADCDDASGAVVGDPDTGVDGLDADADGPEAVTYRSDVVLEERVDVEDRSEDRA